MKTFALIALLIATPVIAQELTAEKLDQAKAAIQEKEKAAIAAGADLADVDAINCRIDLKPVEGEQAGPRGRQAQSETVLVPADTAFATVFNALKGAAAADVTAAEDKLEEIGIEAKTVAPAEPK